jgi:hypothetical protein
MRGMPQRIFVGTAQIAAKARSLFSKSEVQTGRLGRRDAIGNRIGKTLIDETPNLTADVEAYYDRKKRRV